MNKAVHSAGLAPEVRAVADAIDQALVATENHLYGLFERGRDADAETEALALKTYTDMRVRYKAAAPGMVTVEMSREEADAWRAAAASVGNAKIVALLRQVAGTQPTGGRTTITDSGKQSVVPSATKAKSDPIVDAITSTTTSWDRR